MKEEKEKKPIKEKVKARVGGRVKIRKYKNGKAFICIKCREQYSSNDLSKADTWEICPRCGADIIEKVIDEQLTESHVLRPGGTYDRVNKGGRKSHIKKVK